MTVVLLKSNYYFIYACKEKFSLFVCIIMSCLYFNKDMCDDEIKYHENRIIMKINKKTKKNNKQKKPKQNTKKGTDKQVRLVVKFSSRYMYLLFPPISQES